jgi:hypothetical protein
MVTMLFLMWRATAQTPASETSPICSAAARKMRVHNATRVQVWYKMHFLEEPVCHTDFRSRNVEYPDAKNHRSHG